MKVEKIGKTYVLIVALLFSVALLPGHANAQVDGALSLANLAVEPNPVIAGQNASIVFRLYNSYDNALENINMQLQGAYPLLNFSPYGTYEISTLGEGLSPGFYTYTLHIPNTTPEGTYTLSVVTTYETTPPTAIGKEVGSSVMPITLYVYNRPSITINLLPSEIIPGSTVSAAVSIANSGYGTARNVSIELLNSTGFEVVGTKAFNIGTLQAGQAVEEQASYYVSSNASTGQHELQFFVTYTTDTNKTYGFIENASVAVVAPSPEIKVSVAGAVPETLYNGYNQTLDLLIQNIGGGIAKNVSVEIGPGVGTQVISSANHFFFGTLAPGSGESEQVLISANYNASNASIVAYADYYSANYAKKYSAEEPIGLVLAPSAQFEAISEFSKLAPGATDVPLTFLVKNNGDEEATAVQLSLQSTYPITPVESTYYISSIAPGGTANVTFLVSADTQAVPGNYPVTIYEQWKQPNGAVNQEYYGTTNYFAKVSAYSGGSGYADGIVIAIIIVIVVVAYAARSRRRHKKK
ncbi:MAG: NEW3 domain-containing protein [Candidatus Micrarchaeaceae archaeon]